jgi:glutamate synthase domain-containing protein 2/glutamate synthase domain-containing protein 1/glutamate synthase domain-containing protein 3
VKSISLLLSFFLISIRFQVTPNLLAFACAARHTALAVERPRSKTWQKLVEEYRRHPGRGGCGVGAVVDLVRPSHDVVELALSGLGCVEHRGGAIDDTGDGAGLLLRTDQNFFRRFIAPGRRLPDGHQLIVGVIYFPPGEESNLPAWQLEIDATLRRHGLQPLGWRQVPVDESALGARARASRRDVWQVLIGEGMVADEELPRALYEVKRHLERWFRDLYIPSLSPSTVVYKALATGDQLRRYYPDLADPALESDVAVFHRRYSTNTFSNWYLAQCFRTLCHNGEINTIKANRLAVRNLEGEVGRDGILMPQGSDSADLDRIVELFDTHGVTLPETLCRLLPLAWADLPDPTPEVVRFYKGVQRALGTVGAWEGPAAVVACDGKHLVAMLDRMGLRPLRWCVTRSQRVLIGSELGAVPVGADEIAETGQLDPGEGLAIDLVARRVVRPRDLIRDVVARSPINFSELSEMRLLPLPPRSRGASPGSGRKPDRRVLNVFGWSQDRIRTVKYMAENGKEPITSMGFDRPLAVFSPARPPLAKYFKQIVAVVTNPPIDPLREGSAFDLTVYLGKNPSVHESQPSYEPQPQYKLDGPFLLADQLARIRDGAGADVPTCLPLDATFQDTSGAKAIARRIADLAREAVRAAKTGAASIVLLSDREAILPQPEGAPRRLPVPMLLTVAALHNALTDAGVRRAVSIVVETGDVQEGHDAALLIANGADAIHPYLMLEIAEGSSEGERNLIEGLDGTLRRVMSKMGITTLDGYRGSRLFEAVGVSPALVDFYLPGIQSRIGGVDLDDLYDDLVHRANLGGSPHRETEVNVYRKEVWQELQETARGNDGAYERFLRLISDTPPVYLRDLLRWKANARGKDAPRAVVGDGAASPDEIIKACFRGAAMSHGALHRTAHRAIAAAFNSFGAASNCGEGGEDERRDRGQIWEEDRSRIRQVGSGRFGVDARFLAHADEMQIKIGQGAKPGEGGMLPAAKVTEEIARIRKTQVGVTLISPPPHHDIYSIEDLAQLIYNLRQVNPRAKVSVKIPAVTDIGTIAVGIAKAGADVIDVSGFEGGTGAASSSSIEHAGLPLERALAETHQALVVNGIRDTVKLRADGGLKTGSDVATVLALGADEVSLGTALMIAEQCIFCHGCSKGNCPAGITTQSDLTARRLMTEKKGRPSDDALPDLEEERYRDARSGVERYLRALGADLRAILGQLGLEHPRELVGRVELLEQVATGNARLDKVDLSELLVAPPEMPAPRRHHESLPIDPTSEANAKIMDAVRAGAREVALDVTTSDRAVGATLAGWLATRPAGAPESVKIALAGYAGQALGFALTDGMRLELEGYANDSLAEAMSGGTLVVRQFAAVSVEARSSASVIGNAACYGATGGKLFVEGRAGQRLGVRNSGAVMVTEGAGKYAFEYMTGGLGVVLGPVGAVIGSGMTGGVVWIYDPQGACEDKLHRESVRSAAPTLEDLEALRALVDEHARETASPRARAILDDWAQESRAFVKIVPAPAPAASQPQPSPDPSIVQLATRPQSI